jgi:hypothetical protein
MGFGSLQHMEGFEVHHSRAKAARFVPPSGFGYPLDGFLPRIPGRFCFTPAALLGFTLRRFHLPGGFTAFRPERTHLPLAQRFFRRRSVRPARRASVSGFLPPGSALRPRGVLSRRPPAPPLGFPPLGSSGDSLDPSFLGSPLTRFAGSGDYSPNPSAPQSIDRPTPRLARRRTEVPHRPRPPLWGFRTCLIQSIRVHRRPGYVFASHRAVHCCRFSGALWASRRTLPKPFWISLGCRAFAPAPCYCYYSRFISLTPPFPRSVDARRGGLLTVFRCLFCFLPSPFGLAERILGREVMNP